MELLMKNKSKDEEFRSVAVDLDNKLFRMTKFEKSVQATDITLGSNCNDFGRIHHFNHHKNNDWLPNPLPHQPVGEFFGKEMPDTLQVEVFQLAVCNFHCWYCFVDKNLRKGDPKYSEMVSAEYLLNLSKKENRPPVIVLSGGQPDLVPEYQLWFLEARKALGMDKSHFIWSDDNLSNDFFWTKLTDDQRNFMKNEKGYARVACLKGYDPESFSFNTGMPKQMFLQQIQRLARFYRAGFNQYGYITLTTPTCKNIDTKIPYLFDKIQTEISEDFFLRIVPLEIFQYNVNSSEFHKQASRNQYNVLDVWRKELEKRFPSSVRENAFRKMRDVHER